MASSTAYIRAECPICVEHFKTPKLLTCGHTFCLACIKQYIGDKTVDFACPVCSQNVKIPRGGVKQFPTVFALQPSASSDSKKYSTEVHASPQSREDNPQPIETKHYLGCPVHSNRILDYFCKTCLLGLCSKCVLMNHKDHEYFDLDCQETTSMALEEITYCEQFVRKKIEDLEKYQATLQDSCKKLKHFCDESCSKITKQTDKIIADLREKCEKTKKDIRKNFEQNNKNLNDIIANNTKHIGNLKTVLKTEITPLSEDSSLNILQSLPKLKDLEKQCNSINIVVPKMTYLNWTESDFIPDEKILGSLEQHKLYIKGLDSVESPQCFMFDSNVITNNDDDFYSEDKVLDHGVVWSCCVWFYKEYLSIDIRPLKDDNKYLEYINIKYKLTLLNSIDEHKSIKEEEDYIFIPRSGDCDYDYLYSCECDASDPLEGFINSEGQFNVRFEIIQVYEIKMKTK